MPGGDDWGEENWWGSVTSCQEDEEDGDYQQKIMKTTSTMNLPWMVNKPAFDYT